MAHYNIRKQYYKIENKTIQYCKLVTQKVEHACQTSSRHEQFSLSSANDTVEFDKFARNLI